MSTEPTGVDFVLPNDDWVEIEPPEDTAFQAVRRGEFEHFRPNLAVYVAEIVPGASLVDVADETAGRIGRLDPEALVSHRRLPDADSPFMLQQINLHITTADAVLEIAQYQTFVEAHGRESEQRWAITFTLTALASEIKQYGPDYQAFLDSAHGVVSTDTPHA